MNSPNPNSFALLADTIVEQARIAALTVGVIPNLTDAPESAKMVSSATVMKSA